MGQLLSVVLIERVMGMAVIYGILLFSGYFGMLAVVSVLIADFPFYMVLSVFMATGFVGAFLVLRIQSKLEQMHIRRHAIHNPDSSWRFLK